MQVDDIIDIFSSWVLQYYPVKLSSELTQIRAGKEFE